MASKFMGSNYLIWAAEEAPSPVLPKPAEIVIGIIAFGLLLLIIRARVVPMFEKAFAARTEAIQGGIERAEQAQTKAAAALSQYTAQLAEVRTEASTIREEARVQGVSIIEEMRAKAAEESARITAAAQMSIEAERLQAIASLRNEVGALATELASKIVGEALDDQVRQSRIVDRFLADLEKADDAKTSKAANSKSATTEQDGGLKK